jgi:group I intron endonuclease
MNHLQVPKAIGVYQIKNTLNGYSYIGSAANLRKRCLQHIWELDKQKHSNPFLQKVWNKYGTEIFEFYVLEELDNRDALLDREQFFLDALIPEYNVCPTAGSSKGRVLSLEHREKLRLANLGKPHSPERIANITKGRNAAWAARPELREVARRNQTGKKDSAETCLKKSLGVKKYLSNPEALAKRKAQLREVHSQWLKK